MNVVIVYGIHGCDNYGLLVVMIVIIYGSYMEFSENGGIPI